MWHSGYSSYLSSPDTRTPHRSSLQQPRLFQRSAFLLNPPLPNTTMPRRAAPRPAEFLDPDPLQLDPTSSSSDRSVQNLAQLRTNWKWAAFSQFFYTFSHLFAMEDVSLSVSPSFSRHEIICPRVADPPLHVQDIEDDLARETNIFLPRVMTRLLFILSYDRKVS